MSRMTGKKVVVGIKQLRKALMSGTAQWVCLAENADPALTEPIMAMCQQKNVEYAWVSSMSDLGRACGIEVGAAAAAVVAITFAIKEHRKMNEMSKQIMTETR